MLRLDRRLSPLLWLVIVAGTMIALLLAAVTRGDPYDMESLGMVRQALHVGPLDVYHWFAQRQVVRWPYPPGFFPWVFSSGWLADHGVFDFRFLSRVPSIAAQAAIAWLVQDYLRHLRARPAARLAAVALISLGPSFLIIDGYHGQIDALAILPGVAAVSYWDRTPTGRRAIVAGLLLGVGADIKTVPILLVLALLPSASSRREALTLVAASAVPVILSFAPFAVAGLLPPASILQYRGLPGLGLSLAVQPDLPVSFLGIEPRPPSGLTEALARHGNLVIDAALLAVAGLAARVRGRVSGVDMAVVLWLVVFAFGVNFFFQYLLWGLPFLLMAARLRTVAIVQAVILGPTLIFYLRPWHHETVAIIFSGVMLILWLAAVIGCLVLARDLLLRPGGPSPRPAPGLVTASPASG